MKLAIEDTMGNTAENLYFIITLFGVLGGAGSGFHVDLRWSPRSGSIDIFSELNVSSIESIATGPYEDSTQVGMTAGECALLVCEELGAAHLLYISSEL